MGVAPSAGLKTSSAAIASGIVVVIVLVMTRVGAAVVCGARWGVARRRREDLVEGVANEVGMRMGGGEKAGEASSSGACSSSFGDSGEDSGRAGGGLEEGGGEVRGSGAGGVDVFDEGAWGEYSGRSSTCDSLVIGEDTVWNVPVVGEKLMRGSGSGSGSRTGFGWASEADSSSVGCVTSSASWVAGLFTADV